MTKEQGTLGKGKGALGDDADQAEAERWRPKF
jgi:hypothetical protein